MSTVTSETGVVTIDGVTKSPAEWWAEGMPSQAERLLAAAFPEDQKRRGIAILPWLRDSVYTGDDLTAAASVGTQVGSARDYSGSGWHPAQSEAGERPYLGRRPRTGRRNLLQSTENFSSVFWSKVNITVAQDDGPVWSITEDATDTVHRLRALSDIGTPTTYFPAFMPPYPDVGYVAIEIKAGLRRRWNINMRRVTTNPAHTESLLVDLVDGVVIANSTGRDPIFTPLGDGWYRVGIFRTPSGSTDSFNLLGAADNATVSSNEAQHTYLGDDSAPAAFIRFPQAVGLAQEVPYQRVGPRTLIDDFEWKLDVTEAGQPSQWFLLDGDDGESLPVTLPDLGNDATVIYATEQGVSSEIEQSVNGAFNVLRDQKLFGMVVVDTQLSEAEIATIEGILEEKSATSF
jgi:hypothetical protein